MKHLLTKLLLMIAPTVMMAKTPILNPNSSASFNIKALDQVFSANPTAVNPNGSCQAVVKLTAEIDGESNCASNNLIYYHVDIDLDSDGFIDMIASSKVNQNFATWTLDTIDQKMKCFVSPNAKGNFSFELPQFIQLNSIKTHKVSWYVYDECGQSSKTSSTFQVKDKKAPTPYCVSINTALMQSNPQMVELWAKDFDKGAFDNCSHQDRLFFTFEGVAPILNRIKEPHFYKKGASGSVIATSIEYQQGKAYRWKPSVRSASLLIKFEYDYNINISVWDEAGNTDFCTVNLNNSIIGCSFPMALNGKVTNVLSAPINDARIQIDVDFPDYPKSQNSNQKGQYYFGANPGGFYQISCNINLMDSFNVNQNDLILLEKHLSGEKPFSYYWQFIAADINKDKEIDLADLNLLKRLVLNDSISTWIIIETNNDLNTSTWNNYNTHFERYFNQYEYATLDFTPILIGDIDGSHTKIDVLQYDSNDKIESEDNSNSSRGQDFLNKGRFSFNIKANNQVYITNNDCKSLVLLSAEIDGASGCTANSLIYYQIDIDLESDGTIDMIASSDVDQSYNSWTLDPKDNILKCFMAPNAQGDIIFDVPQFYLGYSTNAHKIHWHIFDKCGASSRTISLFYILDKAAPTAICVSPITSYMQSNPTILELWAKDLDNQSFDICSSKEKLIFTFDGVLPIINRRNEPHYFKSGAGGSVNATATEYVLGKAYRWLPALRSAAKVWTAEGEYKVIFSVFDESGNVGFCNSMLKVIGCDMPLVLKGKVTNVNFKPLKNAVIRADANYPEFPKERLSSNIGLYNFGNFQCGFHYFLTGNFTLEDKKSVNQKDILRLESHLNGQKPFVYYWQFIAADINQDKEVNNMDLSLLKTQISNNSIPSWNVFQTNKSLNNFTWREYIQNVKIDSTKMGTIEIDFTAVLIGDVNGSHLGVEVDKIDPNDQISNNDEMSMRSLYGYEDTDFKAYPNPYADQFTIEFSNTQDEVVKLTLMDISGKVTHSMELQSFKGKNIFTIQDSFSQTSGIKMIRLESVSGVRHLKLVKTNSYP